MRVDFLPKQYQITIKPEDFLELILAMRQYLKEFPDGTYRLQEMLDIFEKRYVGDLPQMEEKEEVEDDGRTDMGGTAIADEGEAE